MKTLHMSIRAKAVLAVSLIVGSVLGATALTYFAVRQQRASLTDIQAAADIVAGRSIALMGAAKDIQVDVVQVQQFLSDISATRGQDGLDDGFKDAQASADKFEQDLAAARTIAEALQRPDMTALLAETKAAFEPYYQTGRRMAEAYIAKGPAGGNLIMPEFDQSSEALQAKMSQFLAMADNVVRDTTERLHGSISLIAVRGDQLVQKTALLGVVSILIAAGIGLLAIQLVVRPVGRMTSAMRQLAEGDLAVTVSGQHRHDELGAMAAAVMIFREHMIAKNRLAAEQSAERVRAEAEKRAALSSMADGIEAHTAAALQQVGASTTAMTATADEMNASAVRTGGAAESAAAAATQAQANAQTVASAAEELSISIREIGVQVAQSTEVVGRAVMASHAVQASIEELNGEVGRIGAVAGIISDIAAKTNLLALNATIEAARAGDAGKGFAVVASEVKQLANQTARSIEAIAQHIGQVRIATGASVSAVAQIEQTIGEVNSIASSIAAAVEEQQAATAEIARNVSETASAADAMSRQTQDVSAEATRTGQHAAAVREGAKMLDAAVAELRHSVIHVVRTSTAEVNRRVEQRYPVDINCRLSIGGVWSNAKVTDLSEHGALVRGAPAVPVATTGTLAMDGVDVTGLFIVRGANEDRLNLALELDAANTDRVRAIIDRVSARQAA